MKTEICPCKRVKCERYGDCEACRAHHAAVKDYPAACDRLKARAKQKAERAERKMQK